MLLRSVGLRRGGVFAPPGPDYKDDFEGHPVATGIPAGWVVGDGSVTPTWSVTATNPIAGSQSLRSTHFGSPGDRTLLFDGANFSDGTIEYKVRFDAATGSNAQTYLTARYVNTGNRLLLHLQGFPGGPQGLYLHDFTGGVQTTWSAAYPVAMGTVYRLKLTLSGGSAIGELFSEGGVLLAAVSQTVSHTSAGQIGLAHVGDDATITYDDFRATIRRAAT